MEVNQISESELIRAAFGVGPLGSATFRAERVPTRSKGYHRCHLFRPEGFLLARTDVPHDPVGMA
jgi:hypothetical protein